MRTYTQILIVFLRGSTCVQIRVGVLVLLGLVQLRYARLRAKWLTFSVSSSAAAHVRKRVRFKCAVPVSFACTCLPYAARWHISINHCTCERAAPRRAVSVSTGINRYFNRIAGSHVHLNLGTNSWRVRCPSTNVRERTLRVMRILCKVIQIHYSIGYVRHVQLAGEYCCKMPDDFRCIQSSHTKDIYFTWKLSENYRVTYSLNF